MSVVFCDVVSRRAARAKHHGVGFFPPGVPESSAASCMRCCPSRGLAGLALRADARSSACELPFDATEIRWPQRTEPHQRYCTTIDITHILQFRARARAHVTFFPPTYIVEILCSSRFVAAMASSCRRTPRRPSSRVFRVLSFLVLGFRSSGELSSSTATYGFYNLLAFSNFSQCSQASQRRLHAR